jgi:Transcriptional regulator, AbiEi antitoxin/Protein of unknown function (DUF559)
MVNKRLIPKTRRFAGIVTAGELAAAGTSSAEIRKLVRRGELLRLGRGVYAPAALAVDAAHNQAGQFALRVAASLALARPGSVASHRTAAIIHGLALLGREENCAPSGGIGWWASARGRSGGAALGPGRVRPGGSTYRPGSVWPWDGACAPGRVRPGDGARGPAEVRPGDGARAAGGQWPGGTLSLTRPPGHGGSRSGPPAVLVHEAALPRGHVIVVDGVPVTSIARTVVDLARTSPFPAGVVVADSALRRGVISKADLRAVMTACERWPGIERAREVVAFSDAKSESPLESISRAVFHKFGLPAPELQVWVGDETDLIARSDFLWRAHRTIAESDGAMKYEDPSRARAQLERDTRLRDAGFEVVHFTWEEITKSPARVVARIQASFRRANALNPNSARSPARVPRG